MLVKCNNFSVSPIGFLRSWWLIWLKGLVWSGFLQWLTDAPFTPALFQLLLGARAWKASVFPVHTAAAARHSSGMRFASSSKKLSVQRQELWSYDAASLTSRRAGNLTLTISPWRAGRRVVCYYSSYRMELIHGLYRLSCRTITSRIIMKNTPVRCACRKRLRK